MTRFILKHLHPTKDADIRVYGDYTRSFSDDEAQIHALYKVDKQVSSKTAEVRYLGSTEDLQEFEVDSKYRTTKRIKQELFKIAEEIQEVLQ